MIPGNDLSRSVFSIDCDREVIVDAGEQSLINLSFKPRLENTYHATLKVENVTSGQHIEYELVGIAEEPET